MWAAGLWVQGAPSQGKTRERTSTGHCEGKGGKHVEGTKSHAKWLDLGKQRHSGMGQDCIFPEGP